MKTVASLAIFSLALLCAPSTLAAGSVDASVDTAGVAGPGVRGKAIKSSSERNDVSPPLALMPPKHAPKSQVQEVPDAGKRRVPPAISPQQFDPVLQNAPLGATMPAPLTNWAGISAIQFVPPDTNGDVGPNHVVQIVNVQLQVWDKSGNSLFGPVDTSTIWQGFGGLCELRPLIDPVLLYDPIADRWVISASTGTFQPDTYQCIAVSSTPDPLGSWNRYAFLMPDHHFQDYAKLGVWPDGYYMSADEYTNDLRVLFGPRPFVFDRASMLAGQPAAFQTIDAPLGTGGGLGASMLPSDLDGTRLPPAGAPNHYAQWEPSPTPMNIWRFHVDWADPANTTFTRSDTLTVAPFAMTATEVTQKGTSRTLDLHCCGLMHRLAYRNFGDHESWVVNHAADVAAGVEGIRWYELRDLATAATIYQQGTFGPDGNTRWMGSAAMDQNGNIALGYSISSSALYPSIRYAGRLATDPLGTLAQGEASAFEGIDFQSGSVRWGDYSLMTVDPADDCTFWYTTEYSYSSPKTSDWRTRIVSFRFPGCGPADPPPAVAISFPANGGLVVSAEIITLSGTASDDTAVSKVEVAIDDGPYALATGTTSWTFDTEFALGGGRHIINVRATDNLGVTAATAVTVDTTAFDQRPIIAVTSPRKSQPLHNTFLVQGTASDPDGTVIKVEVAFDGSGAWMPCSSGSGTWFCGPFSPDQFAKGKHLVRARATDNLGARTVSPPVDFKV